MKTSNGRRSGGPRSAAGKVIASRNALRHGLAALTHLPRIPPSAKLARFAQALCGTNNNAALYEQALVIAEETFVLRAIRAQRLAVIERLREPSAIAFAKGDNSLKLAKARLQTSEQAWNHAIALRNYLLEKQKDELTLPFHFKAAEGIMSEIDLLIPPHLEESSEQRQGGRWEAAAARHRPR